MREGGGVGGNGGVTATPLATVAMHGSAVCRLIESEGGSGERCVIKSDHIYQRIVRCALTRETRWRQKFALSLKY